MGRAMGAFVAICVVVVLACLAVLLWMWHGVASVAPTDIDETHARNEDVREDTSRRHLSA